jgi:hypothetical protein
VSACRRVGVSKASSTSSRPPEHYGCVEKQSTFARRSADPFLPLADTLPQLSAKSKPKNWLDEFLAVGYDVPQV